MKIDSSILMLLNWNLRTTNRSKINLIGTLSQNALMNLNNNSNVVTLGNLKPNGIYNRLGQLENPQKLSDNIWDSNGERLPDNNNPAFLYPPKSIKELLNEAPPHLRYTGKLTSSEIAEKWATTGEITPQEDFYLSGVNMPLYEKTRNQAQMPRLVGRIDRALLANGITLNQNEELTISVDRNNQLTVSGINDPERSKIIQTALQSYSEKLVNGTYNLAPGIKEVYFCNSQNVSNFSLEVRSLNLATMTASTFLYRETGGKVNLDDLSIVDGKIAGLPPELAKLLNGDQLKGVIKNGLNLEGVRVCIMQVKAYEAKYGKENLPTVTSNFTYKNGKLTLVEDPNLPQKAKAITNNWSFNETTIRMIDNNPLQFYQSMAKK